MSAKKPPDDGVITKELTIVNKLGIHARPAALFVKTANRLPAISLSKRTAKKSTARASWA